MENLGMVIGAVLAVITIIGANLVSLKHFLRPIEADICELKSDVKVLKSDVSILKTDVAVLKSDMTEVKSDIREINQELKDIRADIKHVDNKYDKKTGPSQTRNTEHFSGYATKC